MPTIEEGELLQAIGGVIAESQLQESAVWQESSENLSAFVRDLQARAELAGDDPVALRDALDMGLQMLEGLAVLRAERAEALAASALAMTVPDNCGTA